MFVCVSNNHADAVDRLLIAFMLGYRAEGFLSINDKGTKIATFTDLAKSFAKELWRPLHYQICSASGPGRILTGDNSFAKLFARSVKCDTISIRSFHTQEAPCTFMAESECSFYWANFGLWQNHEIERLIPLQCLQKTAVESISTRCMAW